MRLPPSVRYLPSRFQVVLNPWLWLGILLTGVVGAYAWQYRQSSGQLPWQIGTTGLGSSGDATSTDVLIESLTPEEQAIAAELDNIELLINQLDSDVSALTTGGEASAAAALNAALSKGPNVTSESSVDRLSRYINEYSFVGTNARGANVDTAKSSPPIPLQRSSESSLTPGSTPEAMQTTSALAAAFAAQQQLEQAGTAPAQSSPTPRTSGNNPDLSAGTVPAGTVAAENAAAEDAATAGAAVRTDGASPLFTFDQTGVVPGSVDGLNRTFIRTTPNMSPPPGTTGYVPPASLPAFNQVNQPSSNSPFNNQSANQPVPGAFGSTAPSVNRPDRSQVLPPVGPSVTTPLETPALNGSSQVAPTQPRNSWESFWD